MSGVGFVQPGSMMSTLHGSIVIVISAEPPSCDENGLVGQRLHLLVSPNERDARDGHGYIATWTITQSSWLSHKIDC